MRSSAAVAGRALIMLACVVAIPALALWGTSWSDVVKRIQDFRWPQCLDLASASNPRRPAILPTGNAEPRGRAGIFCLWIARLGRGTGHFDSCPAAKKSGATAPSGVVPIGYQAPAEYFQLLRRLPTPRDKAARRSTTADRFQAVQGRLRQLGATYYLLESWGNQQQLYRFYCKMAVGGSAQYTRCFEATDADALQSMVQVLRQVESWRDGGLTKADSGD